MLDSYYKDLNTEHKLFAIQRIASRTDSDESIVKIVLEDFNPLMEIENDRVVINRNSYNKLIQEINKKK